MKKMFLAAAVAALGIATAAHAGDTYKFTLINKTTKYPITGFETFEDGKWSKWEGVDIKPGESSVMDWNSDEGDCVVPFKVLYENADTEQYKVDWCKVHNITVTDDDVTYD